MTKSATTAALIWSAALGVSAVFGSYFFACVFPFAAIATIAALTLDVRRGLALVGATWLANQIVGFSLMNYPQTFDTVALGVSLGLGALAAYGAARLVLRISAYRLSLYPLLALSAAFVAYQIVIFGGALAFGGVDNFSPAIIAGVASNDAFWFAGLITAWLTLQRALPVRFADPQTATA